MAHRDPLENPQPLIRRVYAYIAYRVGDGVEAEDLTAETFERAGRHRHSFDQRQGDPAAWLTGIAARCVNERRTRQAGSLAEPTEPTATDLRGAVAQLSPGDRELVALRYGAELTPEQIAALLGIRTASVEAGLHLLLRTLRDVVGEAGE